MIEGHAGPVVGGAARFPPVGRPSLVSKFTGVRNSMECPAKFSGAHVVSSNVTRGSRQGFGIASAHDDQVFLDNAGARQAEGLLLRVPSQVPAAHDLSFSCNSSDGLSG